MTTHIKYICVEELFFKLEKFTWMLTRIFNARARLCNQEINLSRNNFEARYIFLYLEKYIFLNKIKKIYVINSLNLCFQHIQSPFYLNLWVFYKFSRQALSRSIWVRNMCNYYTVTQIIKEIPFSIF